MKQNRCGHLIKAQFQREVNCDEFYTPYYIIAEEVQQISAFFDGKVVYNNCDDGAMSNFYKYFKDNFNVLKLKKLVATGFDEDGVGHKFEFDGVNEMVSECDGDFMSNEGIMQQCDCVVTNPPFSKYTDFMKMLERNSKYFVIVGSPIKMQGLIDMMREGKLSFGRSRYKFTLTRCDGLVAQQCIWLSNVLPDQKPKYQRKLTAKFADIPHTFFDGTFEGEKVLYVKKSKDIPCDYAGFIGVPVTFGLYDLSDFGVYGMTTEPAARRQTGIKVDGKQVFIRIIVKRKPV